MPEIEIAIPEEAPVMVLPNAVLLPHSMMPLYIFEPRYRAMLQWALEHDRMFCIGLERPKNESGGAKTNFFPIAGLGLIRACVGREDGTSHLMLQGIARVRCTRVLQSEPFYRVKILEKRSTLQIRGSEEAARQELITLMKKLRETCRKLPDQGIELPPGMIEAIGEIQDPDVLADSVAHTFLGDGMMRQYALETFDVRERLEYLVAILRKDL